MIVSPVGGGEGLAALGGVGAWIDGGCGSGCRESTDGRGETTSIAGLGFGILWWANEENGVGSQLSSLASSSVTVASVESVALGRERFSLVGGLEKTLLKARWVSW